MLWRLNSVFNAHYKGNCIHDDTPSHKRFLFIVANQFLPHIKNSVTNIFGLRKSYYTEFIVIPTKRLRTSNVK